MSFGNMWCLQFCSYKCNEAAVRYLQFCSHVYVYGKKGNEHDKEYSLLKHERFSLSFICLCFSLKPISVLQSILLIVSSHWEKELLFDEIPGNIPTERIPQKTKPWKDSPKN